MLVLSSVATREAHPSPRFCVWDLQDVISLLNRDNHRSLPKIVGETLQVVILIQRHVSASHQKWNVRVVEPVTVSHYKDTLLASVYII